MTGNQLSDLGKVIFGLLICLGSAALTAGFTRVALDGDMTFIEAGLTVIVFHLLFALGILAFFSLEIEEEGE